MTAPETEASAARLELRQLSKSFGGVFAVDNVDFALAPGALHCVIGPNGCGKSTLVNLISGYLTPTSGDVFWRSRSLVGLALHRVAAAGVVRKFQAPSVFASMSVEDNLRASLAAARKRADRAAVEGLLALVRLGPQRRQNAGELAHGQKQWLELAMILAGDPQLLLLDEPVAGMTRPERFETARLIAEVRAERGLSVLVIEHDMDFVEALDCPVSVMMLGRILTTGPFAAVRQDARVREAYLGAAYG